MVAPVGPFQSDALLVPRLCLFDHSGQHMSTPRPCRAQAAWNGTARAACLGRRLALQSYAVIQPCGVDRFGGVEFVCCPSSLGAEPEQEEDEDDDEEGSSGEIGTR